MKIPSAADTDYMIQFLAMLPLLVLAVSFLAAFRAMLSDPTPGHREGVLGRFFSQDWVIAPAYFLIFLPLFAMTDALQTRYHR